MFSVNRLYGTWTPQLQRVTRYSDISPPLNDNGINLEHVHAHACVMYNTVTHVHVHACVMYHNATHAHVSVYIMRVRVGLCAGRIIQVINFNSLQMLHAVLRYTIIVLNISRMAVTDSIIAELIEGNLLL